MNGLVVGSSRTLHVREETVALPRPGVRLLYASDLHLGRRWTRNVPDLLTDTVDRAAPDVVLLGGDLVDGPRGLRHVRATVEALARRAVVAAVPGNHDALAGRAAVRKQVVLGGGAWLPDGELTTGGLRVVASPDEGGDVLCGHVPWVFPRAVRAGIALTLAGHLHGCQAALWTRRGRMYPGAFVYRWNGLRFSDGDSTLLVSRGAGDTVPVRWNCPREVLLVSSA